MSKAPIQSYAKVAAIPKPEGRTVKKVHYETHDPSIMSPWQNVRVTARDEYNVSMDASDVSQDSDTMPSPTLDCPPIFTEGSFDSSSTPIHMIRRPENPAPPSTGPSIIPISPITVESSPSTPRARLTRSILAPDSSSTTLQDLHAPSGWSSFALTPGPATPSVMVDNNPAVVNTLTPRSKLRGEILDAKKKLEELKVREEVLRELRGAIGKDKVSKHTAGVTKLRGQGAEVDLRVASGARYQVLPIREREVTLPASAGGVASQGNGTNPPSDAIVERTPGEANSPMPANPRAAPPPIEGRPAYTEWLQQRYAYFPPAPVVLPTTPPAQPVPINKAPAVNWQAYEDALSVDPRQFRAASKASFTSARPVTPQTPNLDTILTATIPLGIDEENNSSTSPLVNTANNEPDPHSAPVPPVEISMLSAPTNRSPTPPVEMATPVLATHQMLGTAVGLHGGAAVVMGKDNAPAQGPSLNLTEPDPAPAVPAVKATASRRFDRAVQDSMGSTGGARIQDHNDAIRQKRAQFGSGADLAAKIEEMRKKN